MKNFKLVESSFGNYPSCSLVAIPTYETVYEMEAYCFSLISAGREWATVKTYANHVARFLDFVVEVGICCLEGEYERPKSYFELVHWFFQAINSCGFIENSLRDEAARRVGLAPVSQATDWVYQSALKSFIISSKNFEFIRQSVSTGFGFDPLSKNWDGQDFHGVKSSLYSKRRLEANSYLAGCLAGGIELPEGRQMPNYSGTRARPGLKGRVLQLVDVQEVIDKTQGVRDRALFLLLAATGIRLSEALQILTRDINCKGREVLIKSPFDRASVYRDMGVGSIDFKKMRFKGRTTEDVFWILELEDQFWNCYESLLKDYDQMPLVYSDGLFIEHDFLFRTTRGGK